MFQSSHNYKEEMTKQSNNASLEAYLQCDQIGQFLHFGQLFQAFGNN